MPKIKVRVYILWRWAV